MTFSKKELNNVQVNYISDYDIIIIKIIDKFVFYYRWWMILSKLSDAVLS